MVRGWVMSPTKRFWEPVSLPSSLPTLWKNSLWKIISLLARVGDSFRKRVELSIVEPLCEVFGCLGNVIDVNFMYVSKCVNGHLTAKAFTSQQSVHWRSSWLLPKGDIHSCHRFSLHSLSRPPPTSGSWTNGLTKWLLKTNLLFVAKMKHPWRRFLCLLQSFSQWKSRSRWRQTPARSCLNPKRGLSLVLSGRKPVHDPPWKLQKQRLWSISCPQLLRQRLKGQLGKNSPKGSRRTPALRNLPGPNQISPAALPKKRKAGSFLTSREGVAKPLPTSRFPGKNRGPASPWLPRRKSTEGLARRFQSPGNSLRPIRLHLIPTRIRKSPCRSKSCLHAWLQGATRPNPRKPEGPAWPSVAFSAVAMATTHQSRVKNLLSHRSLSHKPRFYLQSEIRRIWKISGWRLTLTYCLECLARTHSRQRQPS